MMKQTLMLLSGFLVFSTFNLSAHADDAFSDTPKIRKATQAMLQSCKKEFPDEVSGKSIDAVDHWSEAQENAAPAVSAPYKKTQCFAKHEIWEKLVQRNEWAANTPKDVTRLPASGTSTSTTSTKLIDGNRVPTWNGSVPIF
jgi:hypothetical protein